MAHKKWLLCLAVALLTSALAVPTPRAAALTRITGDGNQPGSVTGYLGPDPEMDGDYACRWQLSNGDTRCYGARGTVLRIGDVAVHQMTSWNDPIAPWGTRVTLPKSVTLTLSDGSPWSSSQFFVSDVGTGPGQPNGWVDIFCGDWWGDSPNYNEYVSLNLWIVKDAFPNSSYTIHFNVPPL